MANPSVKFSLSLYMLVDALVDYWRRLEEGVEGAVWCKVLSILCTL